MKRSTFKPFGFLLICVVVLVGIWLLVRRQRPVSQISVPGSQVSVITSFYPLYYFASQIGGQHVSIVNITPVGTEPHDYEPTTQQLAQLERSQLLLINGGGFEPWAERLLPQLPPTLTVVSAADHIPQAASNPHIWLSPRLAQQQVSLINQALTAIAPEYRNNFEAATAQLEQELYQLDQEYTNGLSHCQTRQLVTAHNAFAHLADTYNLEIQAIAGLSPDEEPSSRTLTDLAEYMRTHQITYVFFETLVSPKLATTLAQETGAQTLVLDPIESLSQNQIDQGENYFTLMRQNLTNLRIALSCQ